MERFPKVIFCLVLFLCLAMVPAASSADQGADAGSGVFRVVQVAGAINPVVARFIAGELALANREDARAFLLELDTPGGLDTAMREIIQQIFGSEIPVIVYVYPQGARAASAGALITLAADFAAMAPGTNIGAAHPVAVGGGQADETMMEKVVSDAVAYVRSIAEQRGRNKDWAERIVRESISTPAHEALDLGVIDLVVASEAELLAELDGRRYLRGGEPRILRTDGVVLERAEMNWRQQILNTISNPNVAYLLLMLGFLGIFFEISQPGAIFPGAVGAVALLLAFFALQTLPINYVGVLLILLAVILFILEIKVPSYGMLTIGGILSMALGSLMLIDTSEPYMQISRAVILATVAVSAGFFILIVFFVARDQGRRMVSGREGIAGETGQAVTDIDAEGGRVFVHGEYWDAFSRTRIASGEKIEVLRMLSGLRLEVRAVQGEEKA